MSPARLFAAAALLFVAGCVSYDELPSAKGVPLAQSRAELREAESMTPALKVDDIARLAMQNSPDLRATGNQRGVLQAQLLQAGMCSHCAGSLTS